LFFVNNRSFHLCKDWTNQKKKTIMQEKFYFFLLKKSEKPKAANKE
jgi:hypothetical protein